jgi:hypothetical protein
LSILRTAQVNWVLTEPIYYPGYYTGDNVASRVQVEPAQARPFRWKQLGIELFDLEGSIEDAH